MQTPNAAVYARNILSKRTEPTTGDDDFPDTDPHPNHLDQVETAFNDALELASYAINAIDSDTTIFPNYFNPGDKAGVKNVYVAILGTTTIPENPTTGNALLANLHIQTNDANGLCDGRTLSYTNDQSATEPYIVLCPNAFKKKAVTILKGAPDPEDNPADAAHYITCLDLQASGGHVTYLMNSLGATLLHEYTHYNGLVESIFGAPIIDQPNGYGPVNVYSRLNKNQSPFNADSYMYYALHVLWSTLCDESFAVPRPGTDDADPDCGAQACNP
ncbi:MAG: hypothetical protein M1827_006795 [Pycnora praestabilis]|nr:MAG: hypothetical protein M1827_006795 [Pycnora praestabilis]